MGDLVNVFAILFVGPSVADMGESTSLAKWSSMELVAEEDDSPPAFTNKGM